MLRSICDPFRVPAVYLSSAILATLTGTSEFFRVRFDRLTPTEKTYLRNMAELGAGPHRSGELQNRWEGKSLRSGQFAVAYADQESTDEFSGRGLSAAPF